MSQSVACMWTYPSGHKYARVMRRADARGRERRRGREISAGADGRAANGGRLAIKGRLRPAVPVLP